MRWWVAVALLLFVLVPMLCAPAAAEPAAGLPDIRTGLLVDPTRELGLADLRRLAESGAFQPIRGPSVTRGFTRDAVVLFLTLRSRGMDRIVLEFGPNFTDEIDIWFGPADAPIGQEAERYTHVWAGDNRPMPPGGLSTLIEAVAIDLPPGEPVAVFARAAATNSALALNLSVRSPDDYVRWNALTSFASGLWLGGMAVLIVVQIVFHRFDPRSYFLILALATTFATLAYVGTLGLSRFLLFGEGGEANDLFTAVTGWLSIAASALCAARILEMRRGAPRLHAAFVFATALAVAGAVLAVLGHNLLVGPVMGVLSLVLGVLSVWRALSIAGDRKSGSRLRALAYGTLALGMGLTVLYRLGLGLPPLFAQSYALSLIVFTTLLTTSLGVRLRAAEAMNGHLRELALRNARVARDDAEALADSRTVELVAARARAEEALAAELAGKADQIRFMEVLSHQYRTPLAVIRTNVDNIGFALPEDDANNQRRIEQVRRSVGRLVETIETNLARSRSQGTAFRPKLERVRVGEIVERAASRARDVTQAPIHVRIEPAADAAEISADAQMLELALMNLLENAVKFSSSALDASVALVAEASDRTVILRVEDQGIGILPDERHRVLRLGERGGNVGERRGTGYGLWLVTRIAEAHEATFVLEGAENGGTRAELRLPRVRAAS